MGGEIIRFIKVLIIFMASSLYCYFITSKLPKGKLRLLSLLPIFSLFAFLPLYLSSFILTSNVTIFVTWLTTFKLLLFSFDFGPLASNPPLSFPLFAFIAFFPTRIKHYKTIPDGENLRKDSNVPQGLDQESPPKLPLNLPAKMVIWAILMALVINNYVELVNPIAKLCINYVTMYLYLDILMSLSNAFVQSIFGIDIKRPFDEPYLMTSLQNFWGRRWNLLVSETLHDAIYKPVRYIARSPRWAAVFVVFTVSGLMHELLFYYITRAIPTWEVTWFFVLHGVCVAVEIELKRMLGKRWLLHWAVSGPLTMVFVAVTSDWWLFPPLLKTDTFPKKFFL